MIFGACLRVTVTYNASETLVFIPSLRLPRRRMKKQLKDSAVGRREFLAATSGMLAAAIPGGEMLTNGASSEEPLPSVPTPKSSGHLRKIQISMLDQCILHLLLSV